MSDAQDQSLAEDGLGAAQASMPKSGGADRAPIVPEAGRWWRAAGDGFVCRLPIQADVGPLAELWAEMQVHYGEPVSRSAAEAAAASAHRADRATGFDPRVLVAVAEAGTVVGALALNVTFPARRLARSLYIRDLYVAEAARRGGVAKGLLREAAALTLSEGFASLDWTADASNAGARRFYERAGAARLARVYYRLEGPALLRAAGL